MGFLHFYIFIRLRNHESNLISSNKNAIKIIQQKTKNGEV